MSFVALYTLNDRDKAAITTVRTFIYKCIQDAMWHAGYNQKITHDARYVTIWFTKKNDAETFCWYRVSNHMYGKGVLTLHMTLFDTKEILQAGFHHELIAFIEKHMNEHKLWYTDVVYQKRFTQRVLLYLKGCYMPLLVPLHNICDRCALCLSIDTMTTLTLLTNLCWWIVVVKRESGGTRGGTIEL